jgi:putative transposase
LRFDYEEHHRHSIRLKGYDYTQAGAYFVTVVAQDRACRFGKVTDGITDLNDAGRMAQKVWDELPIFYPGVLVDACVVMPNHVHGIIVLVGAAPRGRPGPGSGPGLAPGRPRPPEPERGQARGPAPTIMPTIITGSVGETGTGGLSLADVVHRFKTLTTKWYTDGVHQLGWSAFRGRLWQRNYFEHVIRDETALERIRRYIDDNPARWAQDEENPLRAPV